MSLPGIAYSRLSLPGTPDLFRRRITGRVRRGGEEYRLCGRRAVLGCTAQSEAHTGRHARDLRMQSPWLGLGLGFAAHVIPEHCMLGLCWR
eukprot:2895863-Rhodomonas_salina.1